MGKIQYRVLSFRIENPGTIIKRAIKLPTNLKTCTGYLARVTNALTGSTDYPDVGTIALSFNSRKEHAVNDIVGYEPEIKSKIDFQLLDVDLNKGELVHCLYVDQFPAELSFSPYKVNVYLRCNTYSKSKVHV